MYAGKWTLLWDLRDGSKKQVIAFLPDNQIILKEKRSEYVTLTESVNKECKHGNYSPDGGCYEECHKEETQEHS